MNIVIGADELIYRIRKNGRANSIGNKQLGRQILDLILSLGGSKHLDDVESFWDTNPPNTMVHEFGLPKTSEQYLISYAMLPAIYAAIDSW